MYILIMKISGWSLFITRFYGCQLLVLLPLLIEIISIIFAIGINLLCLRPALVSNFCKMVLESAKLTHAIKLRESVTSWQLGSQYFWDVSINFGKSTIPPLFNDPEVLYSASDNIWFVWFRLNRRDLVARIFTNQFYLLIY